MGFSYQNTQLHKDDPSPLPSKLWGTARYLWSERHLILHIQLKQWSNLPSHPPSTDASSHFTQMGWKLQNVKDETHLSRLK